MQTRKEVDTMHAAPIHSRPMLTIITALVATALATSIAPITDIAPVSDPGVMPLPSCPPSC